MGAEVAEFLDVDASLIKRFLILFRDNYREVDLATLFLEQSEGISNAQSFLNVRDAMSHFVTALSPETPAANREEQLATCEEHLRRAILEPYETTLSARHLKLTELIEEYKQAAARLIHLNKEMSDAPNEVRIESALREIRRLRAIGRAAKGKNLWNTEWREGVKAYQAAYEHARALYAELETHLNRARAISRRRRDRTIAIAGVIIGALGLLAAFFF